MQVTVHLAPDLQAQLVAEAHARGLGPESDIVEKLGEARPVPNGKTVSDAIDAMRELRKGNMLGGIPIKELIEEGRRY